MYIHANTYVVDNQLRVLGRETGRGVNLVIEKGLNHHCRGHLGKKSARCMMQVTDTAGKWEKHRDQPARENGLRCLFDRDYCVPRPRTTGVVSRWIGGHPPRFSLSVLNKKRNKIKKKKKEKR